MRVLLSFCIVGCLVVCCGVFQPAAIAADKITQPKEIPNKFEALKRFSQVLDLVERHYVHDVTQDDLVKGAVKGLLQGLDPHSTFMNADEYKEMQQTTSGEFFGVGIEISLENGQVIVVTPIEDTPAFRAGLQTGDVILSINGQATQELSLQEVVSRIRGPKGTEVELTIMHSGVKNPQTVHIVRDAIPLISVKSKKLEDGYYWMRLTRFSERTTEELKEAFRNAEKESVALGGIKGIVLDLRNNPGGLLDQAVSIADVFLRDGTIVSIKGRHGSSDHVYEAQRQSDDVHTPVVALINAGSASASEIVAGALRDQKRALIMGERSFGKGSVQKIIPLPDGSGLKLTVALYYTPSGSSIQAEGIVPDMEIALEAPQNTDDKDTERFQVREQDLNRHLENGKDKKSAQDKVKKEEGKDQLARDNQLRMALQVVKSLPKMQSIKN
ncbi:MAG: carboxy-terminal-processing protease [Candidatus Desulfovibrio kirbyi]|uniref:Carboxy-terminal-processing protease n=2 Tax=Candidatus Desulfovibrio kirbyi TaxID=2696086 RepID=A0A6L2R7F8_9BACT|nr:MAG: carboxy-terminal-processing protease [Candidatus Desulfovibrio kirbyi]